ncbi:MAG: hypothetical protein GY856_25590 [bacterium]|nr:hypothetical protein [bacterium]
MANGGPAGQVTVTRTGDDDAVTVAYSTADGTARVDQDYRQRSGTLSWADGDDAPRPPSWRERTDPAVPPCLFGRAADQEGLPP